MFNNGIFGLMLRLKPITWVSALALLTLFSSFNAPPTYKMAKLKYSGGGDWYGDRTALPNLIKFCNDNLKTNFQPEDEVVDVGSAELFNYPFCFYDRAWQCYILRPGSAQLTEVFNRRWFFAY